MRVRVNSLYRYDPCLMDMIDPKTDLHQGDIVRVKNMHGCPPANTMGQCYVFNPITDEFIGMVATGSLDHASQETLRIVRNARRCNECGYTDKEHTATCTSAGW